MFNASRNRVRAVVSALAEVTDDDLYAIPHSELLRLRSTLDRAADRVRYQGRDRRSWPEVRKHLAALLTA